MPDSHYGLRQREHFRAYSARILPLAGGRACGAQSGTLDLPTQALAVNVGLAPSLGHFETFGLPKVSVVGDLRSHAFYPHWSRTDFEFDLKHFTG